MWGRGQLGQACMVARGQVEQGLGLAQWAGRAGGRQVGLGRDAECLSLLIPAPFPKLPVVRFHQPTIRTVPVQSMRKYRSPQ